MKNAGDEVDYPGQFELKEKADIQKLSVELKEIKDINRGDILGGTDKIYESGNFFKGIMYALPISFAMWLIIIACILFIV